MLKLLKLFLKCVIILLQENEPCDSRVRPFFLPTILIRGGTLFVRRIRLLSFGTASGHIKYKGYNPPATQVRNMVYIRFLWGSFLFLRWICGTSWRFWELKVHKVRLRPQNHQPAPQIHRKKNVLRRSNGAWNRSLKYTKCDCTQRRQPAPQIHRKKNVLRRSNGAWNRSLKYTKYDCTPKSPTYTANPPQKNVLRRSNINFE